MRAKEDSARQSAPVSGKTPLRTMETKSENNRFVREGKVAGWRDRLTSAQLALIEQHAGPALSRLGYPLSGASFVPASNG
jgi:hypothetical protein